MPNQICNFALRKAIQILVIQSFLHKAIGANAKICQISIHNYVDSEWCDNKLMMFIIFSF